MHVEAELRTGRLDSYVDVGATDLRRPFSAIEFHSASRTLLLTTSVPILSAKLWTRNCVVNVPAVPSVCTVRAAEQRSLVIMHSTQLVTPMRRPPYSKQAAIQIRGGLAQVGMQSLIREIRLGAWIAETMQLPPPAASWLWNRWNTLVQRREKRNHSPFAE